MKKLLLSITLLGLVSYGHSQVDEEAIFIKAGLNFGSADGSMTLADPNGGEQTIETTAGDFGINLGGGYMFTENIGGGLAFGYNSVSQKGDLNGVDFKQSVNTFMVMPYLRTYLEVDEPFYAVFDLNFGFGSAKTTQELGDNSMESSVSLMDINITPGFTYFVTDNFGLELWYGYIGYNSSSQKLDDGMGGETKVSSGGFLFNADMSTLQLGLIFMFNN